MTISNAQAAMIQGALDSLGTALTDHEHEWTDGERTIYEQATEFLRNRDYSDRVEELEAQLKQANETLLRCEDLRSKAEQALAILEDYLSEKNH